MYLLCLEPIAKRNLPGIVTAFHPFVIGAFCVHFARLVALDVVVHRTLQMFEEGNTSTYIDTECSLSEGITASFIPLEVLVANIDAPLWTCKNKDVGQAT